MICNFVILQSTHLDLLGALDEILLQVEALRCPLRLVFFANISSNDQYEHLCSKYDQYIASLNIPFTPLASWVAQPPLGEITLYCEVTLWKDDCFTVEKKTQQDTECESLTLISEDIRYTILHADSRSVMHHSIYEQGNHCFESIKKAISTGNHNPACIARQWNYIEQIVDFDGEKQHYQMFNDSRSEYYDKINWEWGYPAATGIGMNCGGVVVDMELIESNAITIKPIDNQLQIAAHRYSEDLLLGSIVSEQLKAKSTPKFERAKWIESSTENQLYVSGTAAIRGEESCVVDAYEQTLLTMGNIAHLKNSVNLSEIAKGIYRIYVKAPSDYNLILKAFRSRISHLSSYIIVQADVCRSELLVEIEGVF